MNIVIQYALSLLNIPYQWGGNNPMEGLDCSGLVQCILASAGIDPPGDNTAQGLYDYFEKNSYHTSVPTVGALAFYGKSVKEISHVAYCLDQYRIIEAGGGDHTTVNKDEARKRGACVRIRLYNHRSDFLGVLKPSYFKIGVVN